MSGRAALSPIIAGILALATATAAAASSGSATFSKDINPPSTTSFDISYVDNTIGKDFVADRTNNAVDLIDPTTDSFVGYIGQGQFVGVKTCPAGVDPHACSGPNGVLTDSFHHLWAGDGNSTVKVLSPTPGTSYLASIPTGGKYRADEMSYDPRDHVVLVANDAEGFLTFIHDTSASSTVAAHFYYADNTLGQPASVSGFATAGNGIEQSVWDPRTGLFYQAVPANSPTTTGRVDVFTPNGRLVASHQVPGCTNGPTGLALGDFQRFLGACG
jgi:hypothetical protein